MPFTKPFCSKCPSIDIKSFDIVHDINVEEHIKEVYKRLKIEIDEYCSQLRTMNNNDKTNDIDFNQLYQQLLKHNLQENFIVFLSRLDGISLSKSTKMKIWIFSGYLIALRPELEHHQYNNILVSSIPSNQ